VSAIDDIDLTGKSWANKKSTEMTNSELGDAADTYRRGGGDLNRIVANGYEREWESRHGLAHLNEED
jgi:hypothetical protein